MGIGFRGVDRDGGLEASDRFGVLPPLLVDEAELVLGVAVVRVDRGSFEHPAVVLPAAEAFAQTAELRPEIVNQKEKEEWRRE